ncbi:hypothetical protein GCM10022295_80710 [Streptomyces osmaniensis]|uniref:Uncharacterized protein n=1 Tax=Streptomyces osmaniensis TaxID=593134 RepID=A0ABP6YN19_9ACTN
MLRTWEKQIPSCAFDVLRYPARSPGCTLGSAARCSKGDRVGVARSYLTPVAQWHTIWRTLANPGE